MNIYQPYEVLADNTECLHLKQSEARERLIFTSTRILPLFIILFAWFFIQQTGTKIPIGWSYVFTGFCIFICIVLVTRVFVTEFKITPQKEIFMVLKTISGIKEVKLNVNDISHLKYRTRHGKRVGGFFWMHTKAKKKYLLISIPLLLRDEHHIQLIKERLNDLLQVPVE